MIIIQKEGQVPELWTTIKGLCRAKRDFSYWTLRHREFPFEYKGYHFDKVKVNR